MSNTLDIDELGCRRGGRAILSNIDLALQSGNVTAVLGPNGAGKSTLLECMAGLLRPATGTIRLNGTDISSMAAAQRARQIAFLPQSPEIAWPIDVESLVALGRIPHQKTASAAANQAAVTRAMQITATTEWAQRPVTELSGGERARVLLARVLASEAQWLLVDEPFAGLDPAHQFEAAGLLLGCARAGGGVVLTIHDLSLAARIADRIVLLHDGRVVADGSPEHALSTDNLRSVYGVEAEWLVTSSRQHAPVIAIHGAIHGALHGRKVR